MDFRYLRLPIFLVALGVLPGASRADDPPPIVPAVAGGVAASTFNTVAHMIHLDALRSSAGVSPMRGLAAAITLGRLPLYTGVIGGAVSLVASAIRNGGLPTADDRWGATGNMIGSYFAPVILGAMFGLSPPVLLAATILGGVGGEMLFRWLGREEPVASTQPGSGILGKTFAGMNP